MHSRTLIDDMQLAACLIDSDRCKVTLTKYQDAKRATYKLISDWIRDNGTTTADIHAPRYSTYDVYKILKTIEKELLK